MRTVKSITIVFLACLFIAGKVAAQEPEQVKKDAVQKSAMDTVAAPAAAIQVKTVEPYSYCAIEMTGSFEQHGAAFGNLYSNAQAQGINSSEAPFGIYYNSPNDTPVEKLKWEVGFPVSGVKEIKDPLKLKKWEFTTLVAADYTGSFDAPALGKLYGDIFAWITKNQYTVCGPMMERFIGMPQPDAQGNMAGHVEVLTPVKKQTAK